MFPRPCFRLVGNVSLVFRRNRSAVSKAVRQSKPRYHEEALPDHLDAEPPTAFDVQKMVRSEMFCLQFEDETFDYLAIVTGTKKSFLLEKYRMWYTELGRVQYPSFKLDKLLLVDEWSSAPLLNSIHVGGQTVVSRKLCRKFLQWLQKNTPDNTLKQRIVTVLDLTRLSHPEEWYSSARSARRKIIMHVGPTNSGKTFRAIQALCRSERGVYAGPLRLLAFEVFDRLNRGDIAGLSEPIPCNMITGDETHIIDEHAKLTSCTVEMIPLNKRFDVAVIDEIQLLGDSNRGSAWTSALLATQAKELHLCGEESAVPLVKAIANLTGDEVIVNKYDRLGPLHVNKEPLSHGFASVRKGDCVVAFSRNQIYNVKQGIEDKTGLRVALAYGHLPGEVRAEQASFFNDQKYDVIVGSDALGMGLNLKIKRLIFSASEKFNGKDYRALSHAQVKQIAGRAGRYGLHQDKKIQSTDSDLQKDTSVGLVTAFSKQDLKNIAYSMSRPIQHIKVAAITPPVWKLKQLAALCADGLKTFITAKKAFLALADCGPEFFIPQEDNSMETGECIRNIPHISIEEGGIMAQSPLAARAQINNDAFSLWIFNMANNIPNYIDDWADLSGLSQVAQSCLDALPTLERDTLEMIANDPTMENAELPSRWRKPKYKSVPKGLENPVVMRLYQRSQQVRASRRRNLETLSINKATTSGDNQAKPTPSATNVKPPVDMSTLSDKDYILCLENFHRCLVLYLWLHKRYPLAFPSGVRAKVFKHILEKGLVCAIEKLGSKTDHLHIKNDKFNISKTLTAPHIMKNKGPSQDISNLQQDEDPIQTLFDSDEDYTSTLATPDDNDDCVPSSKNSNL